MASTSFDDALRHLGLGPDERDLVTIRAAYLTAIRSSHPDRNGADDAHARSARLTEAYRLVCSAIEAGVAGPGVSESGSADPQPPAPEPPQHVGNQAESYEIEGWVRIVADDTIELGAPADLAFRWLELASHRAGDITYLDRPAAMLQILVAFEGYPLCYVVFDLQGRAAFGTTEVFCSIDSLDDRPPPPISAVTEYLAAQLEDALD